MSEQMSYITIEPVIDEKTIRAYAEQEHTEHPWVHIAGMLKAYATIAEHVIRVDEGEIPGIRSDSDRLEEIERFLSEKHREASETFLSFFGGS